MRFAYDGDAMIAEYHNATTLLRRYVHGSNAEADDPLVWYEGTSVATANARHLHADPRGSIVLVAGSAGQTLAINTYDEYGIPDSASGNDIATKGRFRYTGQMWLPELDMYHYKARVYSPTLGRFLQTDPIGYEDQFNLYAYVGNDPVNGVDPTGTEKFDEEKYKGSELKLVRALNLVTTSKGNATATVKIGQNTFKITKTVDKEGESRLSVSSFVKTPIGRLSVTFSGTYKDIKGREGFTLSNTKVSGDVKAIGNPGMITVYGAKGKVSGAPGVAWSSENEFKLKGSRLPASLAPAQKAGGKGQMLIPEDENE